jgi:hypothetical protein
VHCIIPSLSCGGGQWTPVQEHVAEYCEEENNIDVQFGLRQDIRSVASFCFAIRRL